MIIFYGTNERKYVIFNDLNSPDCVSFLESHLLLHVKCNSKFTFNSTKFTIYPYICLNIIESVII